MGLLQSTCFSPSQPHSGLQLLEIAFPAVDPALLAVLCSELERPFFVPSPASRIPERAEGVKGTETLAELGGLPPQRSLCFAAP
jgi:hypothetical protein